MTRGAWILPLLLALLSTFGGGCRFSAPEPPPAWSEEFSAQAALPAPAPAPYRVGVLLPRFEYQVAELHAGDPFRRASQPDARLFRRDLVAALRAAKLFTRAEPRGARGAKPGAAESEAWQANDDLLLELELLDYHQVFLGHGEGHLPWFLTYVSWIWPAWWIPSEKFGGGLALRVRLRDVQGRHDPIVDEVIRVAPEDSALELTPLERGLTGFLDLGALWNIHASFDPANWREVEKWIGPRTRRQLYLRLLGLLSERVVAPLARADPSLTSKASKRLALVVGVTKGSDPRLGDGAHAEADAQAIAGLWSTPAGGNLVAGRELKTLLGEQATGAAVLSAIKAMGGQASASDEVIVYLAGQGTTTDEGPSLLLHDANLDDLAGSSLSLGDLGAALRELSAGRVLLILDASFTKASSGGRTFAGTEAPAEPEQVRQLLALGPGKTVILAAQPGEGARVLEDGEAGLFTQVLKEGVAGRADADGDSRVTVRELYDYLRLEVPSRAALERHDQTPLAIGLPDLDPQDQRAQQAQFGWPR